MPGRLLFVFRWRGQPWLNKQAVDLGLQVGDRLIMCFERALLFHLILDQLANGHFRCDLFLLLTLMLDCTQTSRLTI